MDREFFLKKMLDILVAERWAPWQALAGLVVDDGLGHLLGGGHLGWGLLGRGTRSGLLGFTVLLAHYDAGHKNTES